MLSSFIISVAIATQTPNINIPTELPETWHQACWYDGTENKKDIFTREDGHQYSVYHVDGIGYGNAGTKWDMEYRTNGTLSPLDDSVVCIRKCR